MKSPALAPAGGTAHTFAVFRAYLHRWEKGIAGWEETGKCLFFPGESGKSSAENGWIENAAGLRFESVLTVYREGWRGL